MANKTVTLPIAHFNDVYRVQPFKLDPSSPDTIDVTQFAAMLDDVRNSWPALPSSSGKDDEAREQRDGLVLFSGDVFSPSVESSVTRGSHMVPVMNALAPDVSLCGNHDFDFGYPHLTKLIKDTEFPWLLSNIIDNTTNSIPEYLKEFVIFERRGIKIGVIGLVEKEWIGTVSNWPPNFEYRDMAEVGRGLSKRLRDPAGEYAVDLIIALTHARVPNDLALGRALGALSPRAQKDSEKEGKSFANEHGADLILGGHDHLYFVSKGVDSWENYDLTADVLGAEDDDGSVLVIKSGTDFRDLSSFDLELSQTSEGNVRRRVISKITGIHHATRPDGKASEELKALLKDVLGSVSSSLGAPVCKTAVRLDVRSQYIRTEESAAANWFADIVKHAYDGALCVDGREGTGEHGAKIFAGHGVKAVEGGAGQIKGTNNIKSADLQPSAGSNQGKGKAGKTVDIVFICAGMLRGDSVYGPGDITLGDILEILPFEDPLVVLEVDGRTIWAALEAGLSTWPAQEGRFPVLAGVRVQWDSRKPKGQRVLSVKILKEKENSNDGGKKESEEVDVPNDDSGEYVLLTREYMAQGHDGFDALKGHKYLIDDESGQMMSAIVRKYLLGSLYVHRLARQNALALPTPLDDETSRILHAEREKQRQHKPQMQRTESAAMLWRLAASRALHSARTQQHYRDHIGVAEREHMSEVDCFDGAGMRGRSAGHRKGNGNGKKVGQDKDEKNDPRKVSKEREGDLLTINPEVDGRFRDVGRE